MGVQYVMFLIPTKVQKQKLKGSMQQEKNKYNSVIFLKVKGYGHNQLHES